MGNSQNTAADDKLNILRDTFRYFKKCGCNDLLEFFLCGEHRIIYKPLKYFAAYDNHLKKFRNTDAVILEIGVQHGGSAQMWKKYFGRDAKIIGVDIDERCRKFADDQISIEIGSQDDTDFWDYFKEKYPRIDVLLDDGGHTMQQQIITFRQMFPHIRDGGIYLCEDCATSYCERYGGGKHPDTFLEFTKRLIDELNAMSANNLLTPNEKLAVTYNSQNIGGIHFYPSMVVIDKHHVDMPYDLVDVAVGKGGLQ